MKLLNHLRDALLPAPENGHAAQDTAATARLAAEAQSAELLGQPTPGSLTPAEAQAAELRRVDPAWSSDAKHGSAREEPACVPAGPDARQREDYDRNRQHGQRMQAHAPDVASAWMRFTDFIEAAHQLEMPTGFLTEVAADYTVVYSAKDRVLNRLDTLSLQRETLDAVDDLSPELPFREGSAVYTVYHEATHAWLDLHAHESPVAELLATGEAHYVGAPLTDGSETSDPARLFQEAAGDYVGSRMAHWWSALANLSVAASMGNLTTATVRAIASEYEAAQSETVFGYSPEGGFLGVGTKEVETRRPTQAALRDFLDCVLLEGRIPSRFDAVPAFVRFIGGASP